MYLTSFSCKNKTKLPRNRPNKRERKLREKMDGYFVTGVSIGVPALITYWLYSKRRDYCKVLENVKLLSVGKDLAEALDKTEDKCLPYAAVTGFVVADRAPLKSNNDQLGRTGVIHNVITAEHKSEWNKTSNSWDDVKRTLNSTRNSVDFCLATENGQSRIAVSEPLWAEGLSYTTIHNKFEPAPSTLADNIFGLAKGEQVKGYETTEEMLLEGTELTGLGKVQYVNDKITIGIPGNSLKYILSTSSLGRIVNQETNFARFLKWLSIFLAVSSGICLSVWIYRRLKKWYVARQQRLDFERLRSENESSAEESPNACLVCLEHPRDVVILNCGHICACKHCADMLTACPMCRGEIARIIPTYNST